jgi:hypothetical protein
MKGKFKPSGKPSDSELTTELLILADGRILVHNLTPAFAGLLRDLNPNDDQISSRVPGYPPPAYELPD